MLCNKDSFWIAKQGRRKLFDFGQAKPATVGVATGADQCRGISTRRLANIKCVKHTSMRSMLLLGGSGGMLPPGEF